MDNMLRIVQHENRELKNDLKTKKERIDKLRERIEKYVEREHKLDDDRMELIIDLKERDDFAQKVVRERNKCQEEIRDLKEVIEMKTKENIEKDLIIEKEREISENLIKGLKDENNATVKNIDQLENESEQMQKEREELEKLFDEQKEQIFRLKDFNLEMEKILEAKEETLRKVISEKESLDLKLELAKEKNKELEEIIEKNSDIQADSLGKELGNVWENDESVEFDEKVESNNDELQRKKNILIEKANELKVLIGEQKFKLTEDLFKLQEEEKEYRRFCQCRGFCRIFHNKHNWYRLRSKEIMVNLKSQTSYQCDQCEIRFSSQESLKSHDTAQHRDRKLEVGEV